MNSQPVRIGIVGMGQRTCHHGEVVFAGTNADVVAICDNRTDRLAHAKAHYEAALGKSVEAFEDFARMIDESGLQGIYIATPNNLHRDMAIAAFERGIDVLCEKPLALSLADCDAMENSARKNKCVLGVAMQMRYRKRYHKVAELIREGAIGKPAMVWCTEHRPRFKDMKDWVWKHTLSGGALVEKNCHHCDIMNLWIQSRPAKVYATGGIRKHHHVTGIRAEIVDHAYIVHDFEDGTRAMLGISFLADGYHQREFGVIGTSGKISFSLDDGEKIHLHRNGHSPEGLDFPDELCGGMFKDFVECVRSRKNPLVSVSDAKMSLIVPLAAELSIRENRVVHADEFR